MSETLFSKECLAEERTTMPSFRNVANIICSVTCCQIVEGLLSAVSKATDKFDSSRSNCEISRDRRAKGRRGRGEVLRDLQDRRHREAVARGGAVHGPVLALTQLSNCLTLKGSFSAVPKPNVARKYALE